MVLCQETNLFHNRRNQFLAENERARKIKRFSGNFSSSIPLLPAKPEFFCPNNGHPQSPVTCVRASVDFSIPLEMLKLKALKRKEEGTDRFHRVIKRDELDVSEIMVVELVKEEYQFILSCLAGVAKTEQFNKFLHFQKEFMANHELLPNNLTETKILEQHESKLAEVRKWVSKWMESIGSEGSGQRDEIQALRKGVQVLMQKASISLERNK
ncbi:LOW QUALITY PROTEIN: uncharacterized protein LOC116441693 [Corvus moneduloides]|uniref:LOW QUALITY PROTEIN: uncharacterized protein LOC116441693 n=1 Tax=Corvus moneduloides TaxID=1196302 RepID=UPI001363280C|nr:LOW QUALITY PROTEIN: uncharacterized protein LOC116441693 [Corvus moneduloides]